MKTLTALVLCAALPCIAAELTRDDIQHGWIQLFDGSTLFGWAQQGGNWTVTKAGNIRGGGEHTGPLRTTSPFQAFDLRLAFRSEKAAAASVGFGCDSKSCSHTLPLQGNTPDWHIVEIHADGAGISAKVDSNPARVEGDGPPSAGSIELRGGPITTPTRQAPEFSSIYLHPLGLHPIGNWKPFPGKTAFFSLRRDGGIHIEGGPGELESREEYGDFILQFEAELHPGPESPRQRGGVFIRATPGALWSGLKIAIDNGFQDKERTQPQDFGSGGIQGRQSARKANTRDFEPMTVTVVTNGPHLATWVNGYQETDWTDDSSDWHRSGIVSLQAMEPPMNVDFRHLVIRELK